MPEAVLQPAPVSTNRRWARSMKSVSGGVMGARWGRVGAPASAGQLAGSGRRQGRHRDRVAFLVQRDHHEVAAGTQLALAAVQVLGDQLHLHRSEEHTSELQSQSNLVCRLLLEKKKTKKLK